MKGAACFWPSTTFQRPGMRLLEGGLERGPLGLGALGQGRDAADGVVAGGEVGEQLRGGRPAPADVGVVRLDRRRACGGCRTPSRPGRRSGEVRSSGHHRRRRSDLRRAPARRPARAPSGSVSGSTPWPRLNTWPGWPALRRRTSRHGLGDDLPRGRRRARGRGCPAGPGRRAPAARAASSGTRQSTPTTSAPADGHQAEQLAGADTEVDAGHAEVGDRVEHPGAVRAGRSARSRRGARAPAQRVEQLDGRGARRRPGSAARRWPGRRGGPSAGATAPGSPCISALVLGVGARRAGPRSGSWPR